MSKCRIPRYVHYEGHQPEQYHSVGEFRQGYFKQVHVMSINVDMVLYVEPIKLKFETYEDRGFGITMSKAETKRCIAVIDNVVECYEITMFDGRKFLSTVDPLNTPDVYDKILNTGIGQ